MKKFTPLVALLICCLLNTSLAAQCLSQGPRNPNSAIGNMNPGDQSWGDASSVKFADGAEAGSGFLLTLLGVNPSKFLTASNYSYTIPANAVITGIQVDILRRSSGINLLVWVYDESVRVMKNGAFVGQNKAAPGGWPIFNSAYKTYGGPNDLWGTTWTPADINSANFGAGLSANLGGLLGVLPNAQVDHIRITVYYSLTPTIVAGNATICSGASTPLSASGATSYSWSPAASLSANTGSMVTASPSVTTTYTVIGAVGTCTNSSTVTINVNPTPTLNLSSAAAGSSVCAGSSTSLTAAGASSYTWSPSTGLNTVNGATVVASPTVSTVYTVVATAANGCGNATSPATLAVNINPGPTLSITTSANGNNICEGSSVTLSASGGTSYTWSPATSLSSANGATVSATPLTTTQYTVLGSSASGCSNVYSPTTLIVNVDPAPVLSFSTSVSNGTVCEGRSVLLTASGGTSYTWSPASSLNQTTGASVVGLPTVSTVYTVVATGANGCSNSYSPALLPIVVSPAPVLSFSTSAGGNTICEGASLTLSASGASSYTWSPQASLSAGTGSSVVASPTVTTIYAVLGTGANGCSNSFSPATLTVNVNAAPNVVLNAVANTICSGGSTQLIASGASSYSWAPSAGLSSTTLGTVTASPVSTTVYSVSGTSSNGCSSLGVTTVTVTVNNAPVLALSTSSPGNTICQGTSTQLTASGASSYTWSPATGLSSTVGANITANPMATTVYTVVGSLSGGCSNSITPTTLTVTVDTAPTVTTAASSATICEGNSTPLNAGGASSYTWSPAGGLNTTSGASVIANPAVTTIYTITGTASNGCSNAFSPTTVTVNVNAAPSLSFSTSSGGNTICEGSTATLTASGATSYTWSPATGLSSTIGAAVVASPAVTTVYTVMATATNGCGNNSAPATFTVNVNAAPSLSLSTSAGNTICNGGNTILSASGASSYTWSPSAGLSSTTGANVTASPSITTVYSVVGQFVNGCSNSASPTTLTVTVNPVPTINLSSSSPGNTICSGNSTILSASGATSYTWSPGVGLSSTNGSSVTANPAFTMVYTVIGSSANGCSNAFSPSTVTVTVNQSPVVGISTTAFNNAICAGTSATLSASGASTYTWSPPLGLNTTNGPIVIANPAVTTVYTVVATAANGCGNVTSPSTVTITVNSAPTLSLSTSTGGGSICQGGNIALTASGANTYTWSPPNGLTTIFGSSTIASPTVTTTYTVVGASTNGCFNAGTPTTLTVTVYPVPSLTITPSPLQDTLCFGQQITLAASGTATTYTWSTGSQQQTIVVTPSVSTLYNVLSTNIYNCTAASGYYVVVMGNNPNSVSINSFTTTTGMNTPVTTNVGQGAVGGNASAITITKGPSHGTATITNGSLIYTPSSGFYGTDTIRYSLCDSYCGLICADGFLVISIDVEIMVPGGISPNGDGIHDVLFIKGLEKYGENELFIFNRWGNVVYSAKPYKNDWGGQTSSNGVISGSEVLEGTYFYLLKLTPDEKPMKGYIELKRK